MTGLSFASGAVALLLGLGAWTPPTRTSQGALSCRPHVVACNFADYYSGTIHVNTLLIGVEPPGAAGSYIQTRQETDITITVTKGVATCSGFQNDSSTTFGAGAPRSVETESGFITGTGLVAVEFPRADGGKQRYLLTAYCPRGDTKIFSLDIATGEISTSRHASEPVKAGQGRIFIEGRTTALGADLVGKHRDPFEYEDRVNGLTGSGTYTWSLKRSP